MPSHLSTSVPFLTFQVTLHDAGTFLNLHQSDQPIALALGSTIDIKDGAWRVAISRPHPQEGADESIQPKSSSPANSNHSPSTDAFHGRSDSDSPLLAKSSSCVVIELSAIPTLTELTLADWRRSVDVNVDAVLDDLRFHTHPPPSTKRSVYHSFTPNRTACKIAFPLTGLFYPERTTHKFDINFVFTLQGVQLNGSMTESVRPTSSASSIATARASGETSRPLPSLPTRTDSLHLIKLPQATLDVIAASLNDGVWGDVCFVLKDPNTTQGYTYVYGNSKLLGRRSPYFRHLIEAGSRNSAQAVIQILEEGKEELEGTRQRFPHEVADSDYCADQGRQSMEGIDAGGSSGHARSRSTEVEMFEVLEDPSSTAAAAASASSSPTNTGSKSTLGRFKTRKLKIRNIFDEPLDIFGHRSDELVVTPSGGEPGRQARPTLSSGQRYIPIADVAVTTFKRVIFWLETDQIVFAPLTSSPEQVPSHISQMKKTVAEVARGLNTSNEKNSFAARDRFIEQYLRAHPSHPAPASAKSVFRLAETYNLIELQALALESIRSQLHPSNILRELFSPFTLKHASVREMQLEFALQHWEDIKVRHSANLDKILEQSHFTPEAAKLLGRMLSMSTMNVRRSFAASIHNVGQ